MTLKWNDRHATGYAEMDAQHRHLFELINRMMAANTVQEIKPLLMQLYKHTHAHFQQEEDLIRSTGFPGLSAHINGHNRLLGRLNAFSGDVGRENFNKTALVALMSDWAMNHIVHDDINALNYLAQKD